MCNTCGTFNLKMYYSDDDAAAAVDDDDRIKQFKMITVSGSNKYQCHVDGQEGCAGLEVR